MKGNRSVLVPSTAGISGFEILLRKGVYVCPVAS